MKNIDPILQSIMDKFNNEIYNLTISDEAPLIEIERGMRISISSFQELRDIFESREIKNNENEIHFFKHVKPFVLGHLLYFYYLRQIENNMPIGIPENKIKYLCKKAKCFSRYLHQHREIYYYYKSGDDHHDMQYFVRSNLSIRNYYYHQFSMLDSNFSTTWDNIFAEFKPMI